MVTSMTGFGQGEARSDTVNVRVEVRSVNHRFCDVQVRLPRTHALLEPRIAARVREVHRRGRIDVTVTCVRLSGSGAQVRIDFDLARAYLSGLEALRKTLGLQSELTLTHLLRLDGVVTTVEATLDPEEDWPVVNEALTSALNTALQVRRAEGKVLARDIQDRLEIIDSSHRHLATLSANLQEELETRLEKRVKEALRRVNEGEMDRGRLLQEVVHLVDRADVTEEITRLGSHISQLADLLMSPDAVGRRIEFLLQEMVRETNTIASKTNLSEALQHTMQIKVELEKIREQVQNIE